MACWIQKWKSKQHQTFDTWDLVSDLQALLRKLFWFIFIFRDTMGKFSVMINDHTSDIGCGYVKFTRDDLFNVFFICNYGSNVRLDHHVYETGPPCSKCATGCNKIWPALCSANENVDPKHLKNDKIKKKS